jgi:hypothetical protein
MKKEKQKKPHFKYAPNTPAGNRERAVAVFLDPHGFVHEKWEFLRQKGMSDNEILGALNEATDGEVIRAAGIEWPAGTVTVESSRLASS